MSTKPTKPTRTKKDTPSLQREYAVGYGRPPKSGQFRPEKSGNPNGRPKGSRNLATNVRAVLGRKIPVLERGQRRSMSAVEAILHRYLEMAIKGDVKAGAFLLNLLDRFQPAETADEAADLLSAKDQEIVDNLLAQFGKKKPKED